jgi:hypothetical protein
MFNGILRIRTKSVASILVVFVLTSLLLGPEGAASSSQQPSVLEGRQAGSSRDVVSILNMTSQDFGYGPVLASRGQYDLVSDGNVLLLYDGSSFTNLTSRIRNISFGEGHRLETCISAIGSNDRYWLIGEYGLVKFDGVNFTGLCYLGHPIRAIVWNGEYFLIGTRGGLFKYDGTSVTEVNWARTIGVDHNSQGEAWTIGWNGEYWLIGGDNVAVSKPVLVKFNGSDLVDLSGYVRGSVGHLDWNGDYWLISTGANLYRYDGLHFETLGEKLKEQVNLPVDVFAVDLAWGNGYWLMGVMYSSGGKFAGRLIRFDGLSFVDLSEQVQTLKEWVRVYLPVAVERCSNYWLVAWIEYPPTKAGTFITYLMRTLFDFQLYLNSSVVAISVSQMVHLELDVRLTEGSHLLVLEPIVLSCEAPGGIGISFSPSSGMPDYSSKLSISAADTANSGNYTLIVVGTSYGIQKRVTITATVVKDTTPPVAQARSDRAEVKVNERISFDASGSSDNLGITEYEWDFGDGSVGTGVTSTHAFTKPGLYHVTLTVADAAGNRSSDTLSINVQAETEFLGLMAVAVGVVVTLIIAGVYARTRRGSSGARDPAET